MIPLWLIAILLSVFNQANAQSVKQQFEAISSKPKVLKIEHQLADLNLSGGHLQGIQLLKKDTAQYFIITASSTHRSYFAIIKRGSSNKLLSINTIMKAPYKHAGGCQLIGNYLIVGVEDDVAKDKSKICVIDLSLPEDNHFPIYTAIDRSGDFKESTAGCVGIAEHKDEIILVVAGWQSDQLDFYIAPKAPWKTTNPSFTKAATFNAKEFFKKDWKPYQNINLISVGDSLYLTGFASKIYGKSIVDLYQILELKKQEVSFKKLDSRKLKNRKGNRFIWGGGISGNQGSSFQIFSCPRKIRKIFYMNQY